MSFSTQPIPLNPEAPPFSIRKSNFKAAFGSPSTSTTSSLISPKIKSTPQYTYRSIHPMKSTRNFESPSPKIFIPRNPGIWATNSIQVSSPNTSIPVAASETSNDDQYSESRFSSGTMSNPSDTTLTTLDGVTSQTIRDVVDAKTDDILLSMKHITPVSLLIIEYKLSISPRHTI